MSKYPLTETVPLFGDYRDTFQAEIERRKDLYPVRSGIDGVDRALGGGAPVGGVTILAAPPGAGKSSMAIRWALRHAYNNRTAVEKSAAIIWSLEMTMAEIIARIVSIQRRVNWGDVLMGKEAEAIDETFAELDTYPLGLYSKSMISSLVTLEMLIKKQTDCCGKPPFVVVDYFQLLGSTEPDRQRSSLAEASRELTTMSARHDCSILAISSTSRAGYNVREKKTNRPEIDRVLAMAKETGQLEYDAHAVIGLCPLYLHDSNLNLCWVVVAKCRRGGRVGAIPTIYKGLNGAFEEISEMELRSLIEAAEVRPNV